MGLILALARILVLILALLPIQSLALILERSCFRLRSTRALHTLLVASVFACARCPVSCVNKECLGADKVDNHSGYSLTQEFLLSVTLKRYS